MEQFIVEFFSELIDILMTVAKIAGQAAAVIVAVAFIPVLILTIGIVMLCFGVFNLFERLKAFGKLKR